MLLLLFQVINKLWDHTHSRHHSKKSSLNTYCVPSRDWRHNGEQYQMWHLPSWTLVIFSKCLVSEWMKARFNPDSEFNNSKLLRSFTLRPKGRWSFFQTLGLSCSLREWEVCADGIRYRRRYRGKMIMLLRRKEYPVPFVIGETKPTKNKLSK